MSDNLASKIGVCKGEEKSYHDIALYIVDMYTKESFIGCFKRDYGLGDTVKLSKARLAAGWCIFNCMHECHTL